MKSFPVGKLDARFLQRLLGSLPSDDPALITGPAIGNDAAVIELDKGCLVVATDPVTFTADQIGWYAVHVNANDVAAMGARPRWFLIDILLPEGKTDGPLTESIFSEIGETCRELGITVCGGHTEVTAGLERPIVVGHMLGTVPGDELKRLANVRPGDRIIMTKGIAIEGTSLIARGRGDELVKKLGAGFVSRADSFIREPGISIVKEALAAAGVRGVHAMHDPTEGGIATGLWEVAEGSGLGIEVYREKIKIYDETAAVCEIFGLDPLGLIASGALLIMVDEAGADELMKVLEREGIESSVIGRVVPKEKGITIVEGGVSCNLEPFFQDEITKAL